MVYLYIGIPIALLLALLFKAYRVGRAYGTRDDRRPLGVEKVGTPAREVIDGVARMRKMEEYRGIRYESIDFYCDRLIGGELISLIDESLDLKQLESLNPDAVKVAFVLLLRDMMQRQRHLIVEDDRDETWERMRVEQFTAGLLYEAQAPMQPYLDWLEVVGEEPEEPTEALVAGLAKQLGLKSVELYEYHLAGCEVIDEMFSSAE